MKKSERQYEIFYQLKSRLDVILDYKLLFNHKIVVQYKNYWVSYIVQEVRIITSFPGLESYKANTCLKSTPKTWAHAGSELINMLKKKIQIILVNVKFTDLTDM